MTVERKKRGEKSVVIVKPMVLEQLRAMGCERFDFGIRRDAGEMILREGRASSRSRRQSNGCAARMARARISMSDLRGRTV
jgi:hypothetical protein